MTYPCCDGAVFLSFVIDHAYSCSLEHLLHLLRGGSGGKVHILRSFPRQKVSYCSSSNPQLKLVLQKEVWRSEKYMYIIAGAILSCDVVIYMYQK